MLILLCHTCLFVVAFAQMAPPKYGSSEESGEYPPAPVMSSTYASSSAKLSSYEESTVPEYVTKGEPANPPGHPGDAFDPDCKYDDVPFTDCDPFHLVKWRQMKLIFGGNHCESYKNETQRCSPSDFPPGTVWLIEEHKKCLAELEHLKQVLSDLHHWIDVIHERGQSLFGAFNELKKHLEDVQRQIKDLHKQDHSYQIMMERLKKELEEWKEKARSLRTEVDSLKAKYDQLSHEHDKMKEVFAQCDANRQSCESELDSLNIRANNLADSNRELKGQLLEAERFKDLVEKAMERIKDLEGAIDDTNKAISDTKNEYHQCRVDILNSRNYKKPTYDKDTHVNLDMQMWITHNETKNEEYTSPSTYAQTYTTPKTTVYTTPYKPYKPYYTTTHRKDVPA